MLLTLDAIYRRFITITDIAGLFDAFARGIVVKYALGIVNVYDHLENDEFPRP